MYRVVPEGTVMERPVALTSVLFVLARLEMAHWVQVPDRLSDVSTATARGPVPLLRRLELIVVIVRSYPAAAVTE